MTLVMRVTLWRRYQPGSAYGWVGECAFGPLHAEDEKVTPCGMLASEK